MSKSYSKKAIHQLRLFPTSSFCQYSMIEKEKGLTSSSSKVATTLLVIRALSTSSSTVHTAYFTVIGTEKPYPCVRRSNYGILISAIQVTAWPYSRPHFSITVLVLRSTSAQYPLPGAVRQTAGAIFPTTARAQELELGIRTTVRRY